MTKPSDVFPAEMCLIPLDEVARVTGWSERSLLDDCRAGVISHINRKRKYALTRAQFDELIGNYTIEGSRSIEESELAAALRAAADPRRRRRAGPRTRAEEIEATRRALAESTLRNGQRRRK